MNRADFTIEIRFGDGTTVEIGGADELLIRTVDGDGTDTAEVASLDDERLNLIRLVREAEITATEA